MSRQPTLDTTRLRLRPFTDDDAPRIVELANEPSIAIASIGIPSPLHVDSAAAWILELAVAWNRRCAAAFAITRKDSPLLGAVTLVFDPHDRTGEVGYWVGKPYRRQGICSEAVHAVVGFGFDTLALRCIRASHAPSNEASRAVSARVGMHCEGVVEGLEVHAIHRNGP